MSSENSIGLKSLNERLNSLEKMIRENESRVNPVSRKPSFDKVEEKYTFASAMLMINEEKKKEELESKEHEMDKVHDMYINVVTINHLDKKISYKDLPKVVEMTCHFVEKYWTMIVKDLEMKLENKQEKGEFKKKMALSLIFSTFYEDLDLGKEWIELLDALIDKFVQFLFNKEEYERKKESEKEKMRCKGSETPLPRNEKQTETRHYSTGSLKKVGKFLAGGH